MLRMGLLRQAHDLLWGEVWGLEQGDLACTSNVLVVCLASATLQRRPKRCIIDGNIGGALQGLALEYLARRRRLRKTLRSDVQSYELQF
jgi:hypothetical protein